MADIVIGQENYFPVISFLQFRIGPAVHIQAEDDVLELHVVGHVEDGD